MELNTYLMSEVKRLERIADASEVEKLQLHLAALEQIRASMGGGTAVTGLPACTTPPAAGAASDMDRTSEILAHAFACGAARVGVVRIGSEEPHHQYSHWHDSTDYRGKLQQLERDDAAHVAKLLAYLDSFKEGSGTTEGEVTEVRLGPLDPLEHEPRATEPVTPRPALKDTSRRTTALAVGATGAGIALVGGAFGLAAIVRRGDAEDACRGGDCHAGETMNRQARTLAWTANVTLATGLIAVAVGIVLYVTSPRSTARAATAFVF